MSFAANITNISDEPAARIFKLPFGTNEHVFVFSNLKRQQTTQRLNPKLLDYNYL
jgi:hypothetical protein